MGFRGQEKQGGRREPAGVAQEEMLALWIGAAAQGVEVTGAVRIVQVTLTAWPCRLWGGRKEEPRTAPRFPPLLFLA